MKAFKLLGFPNMYARMGACQVLAKMQVASAVEPLRKCLKNDHMWLRVKAAEALAEIGRPAMSAVPELLIIATKGESKEDPRGMEQRFLNFAIFDEMLRHGLDGVDRKLLREVIVAGLKNDDGRARSSVGKIYRKLSYDDIKPLLPAIYDAVKEPAPSGIMFADGVRLSGLDLLAKHHIKEGLPLCLEVMDMNRWGRNGRIGSCINSLSKYGSAVKPLLPELRQLEKELKKQPKLKNVKKHIEKLQKIIQVAESGKNMPKLISLKSIK